MPKMPLPPAWVPASTPPTPIARPGKNANRSALLRLLQQGIELQRQEKFVEAERCYQIALHHDPDMPEAQNLMGTLALEADKPDIALEYFEAAVKRLTKNADVRHNLGSTLMKLHEFDLAAQHLNRAIDIRPGQVETLCMLGQCYNRMGRSQEALPFLDKAIRLSPQHEDAKITKADALINLGRMDEAEKILLEIIATGAAPAHAYRSLASARTWKADSPELQKVLDLRQDKTLPPEQAKPLAYAAGKMLNDAKRHDEAIAAYQEAKQDQHNLFDIHAYRRHIDNMITLFNPGLLLERRNIGHQSTRPVFIVGMPRSGTTLTEQIISSHPHVAGAGELSKMGQIARGLGYSTRNLDAYATALRLLDAGKATDVAETYLRTIDRYSRDALRVTDKMPHNFEQVGLILLLFPHARIIHCRRDPIDNCMSCYMNAFNDTHSYNADFETLGLYYREYDRLMRHWDKLFPGRIFTSVYEELTARQEQQSRALIDFIGLPWDDACLNFTENQKAVTTISRWQVRQPIYRTSVKRWKNYEAHIGELIKALGSLAEV